MTWSCYQMPSWSTCPMLQVLTFQSSDPVQVTGTVWTHSRRSSTRTFPESTALLHLSTSQPRETFETSHWWTSPRNRLKASPRGPLGPNAALTEREREIGAQTQDTAIGITAVWVSDQVNDHAGFKPILLYVGFWMSFKIWWWWTFPCP